MKKKKKKKKNYKLLSIVCLLGLLTTGATANEKNEFEAEKNFSVVSDMGNNSLVKVGKRDNIKYTSLFDAGDKMGLSFNIAANGTYDLRLRVRAGWISSNKYKVTLDGSDTLPSGKFDKASNKSYGRYVWSDLVYKNITLTKGNHSLEILAKGEWQMVDVLKINMINKKPIAPVTPVPVIPVPTPTPVIAPVNNHTNLSSYYKPTLKDTWQWQLKGKIKNINHNATIYDIDLFKSSPKLIASIQKNGKKVMCSFSVGSYEEWKVDKDDFKPEEIGNVMDGWADEKWIDIRSENIRNIMKRRIDLAAKKGCDGLEPDNMNGYEPENDTGFDLTAQDQIDYNQFLARYAHKKGLFIALKNDLAQIETLVKDFDLSVNEECFQYEECAELKPFIKHNKPVFNAEYIYNTKAERNKLCTESKELGFYTLVLPLGLDDSFRFSCRKN